MTNSEQTVTGFGPERCRALSRILEGYRQGKQALDSRVIQAEEYWRLRHWRTIRPENPGEPEPASGWLVNTILSKHSDAMDAYPEPVCLAREESDRGEARSLSDILPVVLEQNDFDQVWSDVWWNKLKSGTGVYGVFWDARKLGGLGDISIRKVDILNLFWEPGIGDIQSSPYLFHVAMEDNERLEAAYPALRGQLTQGNALVRQYRQEEAASRNKSAVIDVYYKKNGLLHYCKYVGETMLVATEADPAYAGRGLYAHGRYPFVFDPLFPEEGYPGCGYGYVDLCRDAQNTVDILNNCILQNTVAAATPRWFVRMDGGVNEAEYGDLTKKFVHVSGRLGDDSVKEITQTPLPGACLSYLQMKVDEMKQVAGNRDVNNGSSSSVTAASAIAALQEAGNGLSRDMIAAGYRAVRRVTELCLELIREFYTLPRRFRIQGPYGAAEYIAYTNQGLGLQNGARLPVFDIQVQVQKETPYARKSGNELAVELYKMGVFDPARAQQSLLLLDMMEFKGKETLMNRLAQLARQNQAMALAQTAALGQKQGEPSRVEAAREAARSVT